MAKNQPKKKDEKKPESKNNKESHQTKPIKKKTEDEETKPNFQELLRKKDESRSSLTSSEPEQEPGSIIEADENIIEVCKDIISIPFEIWSKINPKVEPLSDSEKKHISQPLARIAVKYDVAKYMKDEFLLMTFLGFAIYKRARIKKDDKDDNREKGTGKDEPATGIN